MMQLFILFVLSWNLIWFFETKNLKVLGFMPTKNRLKYFSILFIISAFSSCLTFLLRMYIAKEEYVLSPSINSIEVLTELFNQVRTVLTEELMCRGALLYILIKRIGNKKGILISSLVFAILHWFNAGVWGNIMQMSMVFFFTFLMGLLLAYAYSKTYSLLMPFAIHFGWNLVQNYIFPDSLIGNHVFVLDGNPPSVTVGYLAFFTMILLPKTIIMISTFFVIKRHEQVEIP